MRDEYSLYDAKAKLSALVRLVREGRSVIITLHGKPAAELRAIDENVRPKSLDERLAELDARRAIVRAGRKPSDAAAFPMGPRRPGALKRFLKQRD
ncbi:MAG: type II toxin-antitoxin system Phd/YefM family antitoxin [Gemmatimonadaceae bacterium]